MLSLSFVGLVVWFSAVLWLAEDVRQEGNKAASRAILAALLVVPAIAVATFASLMLAWAAVASSVAVSLFVQWLRNQEQSHTCPNVLYRWF